MNSIYNVTYLTKQGKRDSMHIIANDANDAKDKVSKLPERYAPVKVVLTYGIDHE
jgi:predicted nucleic acid-binding Zn finger protein